MDESRVQHQLSVISEPTRFRTVELLKTGPKTVGSIVDALGVGQPQVSRHLRILADAGVVGVTKHAQRRIYGLEAQPLKDIDSWIRGYAELWSERMDRLGAFLDDEPAATAEPDGDPRP